MHVYVWTADCMSVLHVVWAQNSSCTSWVHTAQCWPQLHGQVLVHAQLSSWARRCSVHILTCTYIYIECVCECVQCTLHTCICFQLHSTSLTTHRYCMPIYHSWFTCAVFVYTILLFLPKACTGWSHMNNAISQTAPYAEDALHDEHHIFKLWYIWFAAYAKNWQLDHTERQRLQSTLHLEMNTERWAQPSSSLYSTIMVTSKNGLDITSTVLIKRHQTIHA